MRSSRSCLTGRISWFAAKALYLDACAATAGAMSQAKRSLMHSLAGVFLRLALPVPISRALGKVLSRAWILSAISLHAYWWRGDSKRFCRASAWRCALMRRVLKICGALTDVVPCADRYRRHFVCQIVPIKGVSTSTRCKFRFCRTQAHQNCRIFHRSRIISRAIGL